MSEVFDKVDCTVSAAIFQKSARATCWSNNPDDGYAYPSAAVFIKKAR